MLLQTPHGNILWDLIAFLDNDTVEFVRPSLQGQTRIILVS